MTFVIFVIAMINAAMACVYAGMWANGSADALWPIRHHFMLAIFALGWWDARRKLEMADAMLVAREAGQ